jgi:hypothetical protein
MAAHFLRLLLFGSLFSVRIAVAQSSLFAPYDCREHGMTSIPKIKELVQIDFYELDWLIEQFSEELAMFRTDTIHGWRTWKTNENFEFGKDRGDLIMISDLQALHPYFRDKVIELIRICKTKGIELAVVETFRTHAKQHEYKTMGRKFTRSGAGRSKHQYGLAVDVVPIVNGEAEWHNNALWRRVGIVGERLGLRWGGRWRSMFDPGHFEWTGGLNSIELSQGKTPYIPKKEANYPCLQEDMTLLEKFYNAWEAEQSALARNIN